MKRLVWILCALPVAIVAVALSVANRHDVRLVLDPFAPDAPAISVETPLFLLIITAAILGLVIGGFATWIGQSKWRRAARNQIREATHWKTVADRAEAHAKQPALPPPHDDTAPEPSYANGRN